MKDENQIIQQVYEAKEDMVKADTFIGLYLPFIKSETAKFMKRIPTEGHDDELSIAMIAFHEAICGYSRIRGSFLKYAAMIIKSRLIDYSRKEKRHKDVLSLDAPVDEEENLIVETISSKDNHSEEIVERDATRLEVEELARQIQEFGLSLAEIADNCPKQQRTLQTCRRALDFAKEDNDLMNEFLRTKKLPMARLTEGSGVERKTLERHRKYMIALLLIHTNGYEIIRGHIKQVVRGGDAE